MLITSKNLDLARLMHKLYKNSRADTASSQFLTVISSSSVRVIDTSYKEGCRYLPHTVTRRGVGICPTQLQGGVWVSAPHSYKEGC